MKRLERSHDLGLTVKVVNFIQQPLPDSGPFPLAGAAGTDGQAGALGMGQQAVSVTNPRFCELGRYVILSETYS